MSAEQHSDILIYTWGWANDQPAKEEPPIAQIKGRMFINGKEIPGYTSARVLARQDEFLHLSVRMFASTLRFVPLADISDISTVLPAPDLPESESV